MSERTKLAVYDTEFNCSKDAARILKKALNRARNKTRKAYPSYAEDLEIAYRDLLLESIKSPKSIVTKNIAEAVVGQLKDTSKYKPTAIAKDIAAMYMSSPFSPNKISNFLRHNKELIYKICIMVAIVCLGLIIAAVSLNPLVTTQDVSTPGGPLNTDYWYQESFKPQYGFITYSIIVLSLAILLLGYALIKTHRRKLPIIVAAILIFSYFFIGESVLPHTEVISFNNPTYNPNIGESYIKECNSQINYLQLGAMNNGSATFYDLQRQGWQFKSLLDSSTGTFSSPACDQYFALLAKYPNDSILLLPIKLDNTDKPQPVYYDTTHTFDTIQHGWFVR